MAFTIGREQLRRSGNKCLIELQKEAQKNAFPEGVLALPGTEQDSDLPAFIRDFAKNSVLLQGQSFDDLFEDLFGKDVADYKATQSFASDDEIESKRGVLRELYKGARFANIDFSQLPWVESRKKDMAALGLIQDDDKLNHLCSLLVLDKMLCALELNDAQYAEMLAKIVNHYSQLLKSQVSNIYTSYLGAQNFGFYQYAIDPDRVTADVRLCPKDSVTVECKLDRDVPVQPGGCIGGFDDTRALASMSAKFELTSDYASLVEIKTEDPIHWVVVMGYNPKNFDSNNRFSSYLDGGPAEPLRKSINLAHYEYEKREINRVLEEEADPNDPYFGLKRDLRPMAKKLISEANRVVLKSDNSNNRDIEALTTHLKALKLCFGARDPEAFVEHYKEFRSSTESLFEMQDDPNQEKSFGVSHRFAKVLEYGLPILGALAFVIGVALAATGIGLALGLGIALGGAMLILISGNLKLPRKSEVSHLSEKALDFFTPYIPEAARKDAKPESDEDPISELRASP